MADEPFPFYDMSWLAAAHASPQLIMEVLDLSDPVVVTWKQGLAAVCGDYWDFDADIDAHLSRVYITPSIRGWRLAVGGWVGKSDESGQEGFETVVGYCQRLSALCGEANAFTSQNRMGWYSWVLARSGKPYRKFLADRHHEVDQGGPVPAELRPADFLEDTVMWIAEDTSICLRTLDANTECDGEGLLAITAWGRQNGVPKRRLE